MPKPFSDDLALALKAAKGAADIVMSYYGKQNLDVELKAEAGNSPVTIADKEVDHFLHDMLTSARPAYGWLSEEIEDNTHRLSKDKVWIVDPIDGTRSFIEQDGCFAISIALVENGRPILGVVHAPAMDALYYAEKGFGAYKNDEKLDANTLCAPVTAFGSRREYRKGMLDTFKEAYTFENYGSIAYKLALVAEGKGVMFSLYPKSEWDCAAGDIICQEAGAKETDIHGSAIIYNDEDVIVDRVMAAPECAFTQMQQEISQIHP